MAGSSKSKSYKSNYAKTHYKRQKQHQMVGWRFAALIGGLVGTVALALYPVVIEPMMNPKKWQQIQKEARAGYDVEKIQPGEMRVWTNPMQSKESSKE